MRSSLKVALDARVAVGVAGGVQEVLRGLAVGFGQMPADRDEQFLFLVKRGQAEWLAPHISGPARLVTVENATTRRSRVGVARQRFRLVDWLANRVPAVGGLRRAGPPRSDGTIEREGVDVMHFTMQHAFITDVPSIYQPWDLQHVHLPKMFTPREREFRERTYRLHCERAAAIVVMTEWGKDDLVAHYGLPPDKVWVVPCAPLLPLHKVPSHNALDEVRTRFDLPSRFALYPAHLWGHKNHLVLVHALAVLRTRGLRVDLVCTGSMTPFGRHVLRETRRLGLEDQIRFLGYVDESDIVSLYHLAYCLVFPSLFEGWGLPVTDAMHLGLPVACSDATVLPEVVGDGAVLFDARSNEDTARAVEQVWTDDSIRTRIVEAGHERVANLSWSRTAKTLGALYRAVAKQDAGSEDAALLRRSRDVPDPHF